MKLVETHQIKPNHKLYSICDNLCFKSKNLYNSALYQFRQSFFNKEISTLSWQDISKIFNHNNQYDYRELPTKVSTAVLKKLGDNISSFWNLIKKTDYNSGKNKIPKYLHKTKGRFIVEFYEQTFSKKRDENNNLIICKKSLNLRIPTKIDNPQQVRIIPKVGCYVIEIIYEKKEKKLKQNQRIASIDLGLNNFAAVVTNYGEKPILISGKKIKSINQYFNKITSQKKSLLPNNIYTSKSLDRLWLKRNNKISYEIHKITKFLANYFDERDISKVVIGNNKGWKNKINVGKRNNQNFVSIPYAKFINQLTYKCKLLGITVVTVEESYTSKASFLDYDEIPIYENKVINKFSGKRIERGLYQSTTKKINADVNGAYNIMVKENINNIVCDRKQLGFNPILIKL
jgi:transposase, IS605 orfB family